MREMVRNFFFGVKSKQLNYKALRKETEDDTRKMVGPHMLLDWLN